MIRCKHSGDKLVCSYVEGKFFWCKIFGANVDKEMCEVCEHYTPTVKD